jgi:hypothetical protein
MSKVALVGNMNNCNFSLLRHLRDLDVDAHLLLFTDEQEHFAPECDSWNLDRWKPYIHELGLPNGNILNYLKLSSSAVRKQLDGYDYYIGNGFAPAYFSKAAKKLNLFVPYAVGVEFIFENGLKNFFRMNKGPKKWVTGWLYRHYQVKGLKQSTRIALSMDDSCLRTLAELGIKCLPYGVVPLYREDHGHTVPSSIVQAAIERMRGSRPVVYSHVAHKYIDVPPLLDIKRNHLLITGFSDYVKKAKANDALLVMHEYGDDVDASKRLISEKGIEPSILWLPRMQRREIMLLLKHAHIGGGEYGGVMWGGTGWEFLAMGIPFFQKLNCTPDEFESKYGMPMPPFLNVGTSKEITYHLLRYEDRQSEYEEMGKACCKWYQRHNGATLARKYMEIIMEVS